MSVRTQRKSSQMTPYVSRGIRQSDDFPNLMSRFFGDDFMPNMFSNVFAQPMSWVPDVEVSESDGELVLVAELPGMTEKDVEVNFEDNVLTISGEKSEERKEDEGKKRFHLYERSYGAFRRAFTLPRNVDASRISAEFRNGLLTVRLPKSEEEKTRGRRIPISATK